MPKIEETLKSNVKSQAVKKASKNLSSKDKGQAKQTETKQAPSKQEAQAHARAEKSGARRLRLEVEINNGVPESIELQQEPVQAQLDLDDTTHSAHSTSQPAFQSTHADQSSDQPKASQGESLLSSAIKTVQQAVSMGAALAEQQFPRAKQTLDVVAQDWVQGGSFVEIPIENPFLRKALQNGLVQARDIQTKVLTHPKTEKVALQLFTVGVKVNGLVEEIKAKVGGHKGN